MLMQVAASAIPLLSVLLPPSLPVMQHPLQLPLLPSLMPMTSCPRPLLCPMLMQVAAPAMPLPSLATPPLPATVMVTARGEVMLPPALKLPALLRLPLPPQPRLPAELLPPPRHTLPAVLELLS
jgi:hypothetical protein